MKQSSNHNVRTLARIAIVLGMGGAITGCGLSGLTSGLGGGIFGSSKPDKPVGPVSDEQLLAAAKLNDPSSGSSIGTARGCPKFVVWPRDRNLTVYEDGREGDGLAIARRGEITKTARECRLSPGLITIRYGFSGRVLLGPRGAPGTFSFPINVFVTDHNREKIQSKVHTVQVTIQDGNPIGYFSQVDTVSFEIPEGVRPADYQLFVGFERPAQKS